MINLNIENDDNNDIRKIEFLEDRKHKTVSVLYLIKKRVLQAWISMNII